MGYIMENEEMEAILEKIWDLHDKLSDAIHTISRAHFLNSIKTLRNSSDKKKPFNELIAGDDTDNHRPGFVFVKDFCLLDDNDSSAIQEAKSLNAIRSALENLEDQLEFFHTLQTQQQAERNAAIARLEQSRIVLAMRLAEHHGKKFKVIEEVLAFVGDMRDASHFVSVEDLYSSFKSPSGENVVRQARQNSNVVIKVLISGFNFAKKSLKLDHVSGILGNAALFTVSMIALHHLHRIAFKEHHYKQQQRIYYSKNLKTASRLEGPSSNNTFSHLDVMLARG